MPAIAIACASLAYLSLLPQFYLIFSVSNRSYLLWDRPYHAAILTALLILALIYLVVAVLARRILVRWPRLLAWLACCAILFVTIRTVVAMLDRTGALSEGLNALLASSRAKIIYYFVIPGIVSAVRPAPLLPLLQRALLVLSPLVLFLILVPLTYDTYGKGDTVGLQEVLAAEDRLPAGRDSDAPDIFVFVFDEWSYDRCFGPESSPDAMPRTRTLMEESLVFTRARSAGSSTKPAMARMLLPFDPTVTGASFEDLRDRFARRQLQTSNTSIFRLVPDTYTRIVSGYLFDYGHLLYGEVDYTRSYNDNEAFFRTYRGEVTRLLRSQVDWLRYFGIRQQALPPIGWFVSQTMIHQDALFVVEQSRRPVMAVFHYCLPHFPYAWTRDGVRESLNADRLLDHTVRNYMDNVEYLDRSIGEVLDRLAEFTDRQAMIVLTSDHSWRMDPDLISWQLLWQYPDAEVDEDPDSPFRHVPLIVHTGRPADVGIVAEPFDLADLHLLISRFLEGKPLVAVGDNRFDKEKK